MSYKQTKKTLQELRTKERQAKQELDVLRERQHSIDADIDTARSKLTEATADAKVGNGTAKSVSEAESDLKALQDEADNLPSQIDVQERVQQTLEKKVQDALIEFRKEAVPYHKKKLSDHFTTIQDALDTINETIDTVNAYRLELQKDQVSDSALNGIKHHSKAVITNQRNGSLGMKNFITNLTTNNIMAQKKKKKKTKKRRSQGFPGGHIEQKKSSKKPKIFKV